MSEPSKICLNMIVKNEAKIILNTLKSLAPYIDYYIIFDTGSLDETPELIRGFFEQANIPGELHFIDFINFEQARNAALIAAQKSVIDFDYIFLCDADLELQVNDPDFKCKLRADSYSIRQFTVDISFANIRLLKKQLEARYIGATHECLNITGSIISTDFIYMKDNATGSSRENKAFRDIRLLREEFEKSPTNTRFCFYLAMSYADLRLYKEAIYYFNKRIELGGWAEEVFYSYMRIALCHKEMESPEAIIVQVFQKSYDYRPSRAEPLYELMLYFQAKGEYSKAIEYGQQALNVPYPQGDVVFVWKNIYDYGILEKLAECYEKKEFYLRCLDCYQQILSKPHISKNILERINHKKNAVEHKQQEIEIIATKNQYLMALGYEVPVSLVITACNRPMLLEQTLESFFTFNTYPHITQIIVIEDSGIQDVNRHLKEKYGSQIHWIENEYRLGQIRSIDKAYAMIKTPYIFHCEEDWVFYRSGFIEASLVLLESDSKMITVWLRNHQDTMLHPIKAELLSKQIAKDQVIPYKKVHENVVIGGCRWHGFSFNPGLRRLVDYQTHFPNGFGETIEFDLEKPYLSEAKIGQIYYDLGYYAVILGESKGYVRHIG